MKFGVFYEHQVPRPWDENSEQRVYDEVLAQIERADRLGYDFIWEVEHHFLEEYSHSSQPEIFLAAAAQRTKQIHLATGIALMPPPYRHPARVAESIATLDLLSHGRVHWGTGESATGMELEGFGVDPSLKSDMWREATEQAANMMAMTPFPGFEGRHFSLPVRNVVPKPVQKPHPPAWVACSRRESIHRAARNGLGALAFSFVNPADAAKWVQEYYDIIKSEECVPLTHTVNANIALVSGLSCHPDKAEAISRGLEGFLFFGYSLGYWGMYDRYTPGRSSLWEQFQDVKDSLPHNVGHGGIGTPAEVRDHCLQYERAGVDQLMFIAQCGRTRHEHILETLETFGTQVMPEFKLREQERRQEKARELAPYIEAALARKPRLAELPDDFEPWTQAGKQGQAAGATEHANKEAVFGDRSVPIPGREAYRQRNGAPIR